ncbi:MAG: hypothetical protein GY851_10500, partial [bacterium]|nr:hypothetical protein [bacterium]
MSRTRRAYGQPYAGASLDRVAFPLGGIGAGMICLGGTGAISHVSVRNNPDMHNEPYVCAAVCVKGDPNVARVLEGPVPTWKVLGHPDSYNGLGDCTYGFPRLAEATFDSRFPFATVTLGDPDIPLDMEITGWSPFTPGDADSSSLPVAALEYRFANLTDSTVEAVYSFNARNFMRVERESGRVWDIDCGFVLHEDGSGDKPWEAGSFCA